MVQRAGLSLSQRQLIDTMARLDKPPSYWPGCNLLILLTLMRTN